MFKRSLLAVTTLTSVFAQFPNRTDSSCPFNQGRPSISDISTPGTVVNSTGSVAISFRDQDPWYLSVLVSRVNPDFNTFSRNSYLSVPDKTKNTSVCLYQFSAMNATATGDSCAGVLSPDCRNYLSERLYNEENNYYATNGRCPLLWPGSKNEQERLREICGPISGNDWTQTRISVPNDTCNYPSLPGVDLPDGYQSPLSSVVMDGSYSYFGEEPASTYDQYAQQVVPFVITTPRPSNDSDPEVLFACVTPNNTQAGSQELGEKPWENAAAHWHVTGRLTLGVAGFVALMLAL